MSKTWYPVIDYMKCISCGMCIDKCKFGVYDTTQHPKPKVINGENCIHKCHGCGNLCPMKAIMYSEEVGNVSDELTENCNCTQSCGCKDGGDC